MGGGINQSQQTFESRSVFQRRFKVRMKLAVKLDAERAAQLLGLLCGANSTKLSLEQLDILQDSDSLTTAIAHITDDSFDLATPCSVNVSIFSMSSFHVFSI